MGYVETVLAPDERLLHRARLHWIIYVPGFVLLAVGGIALVIASNDAGANNTFPSGPIGLALIILAPVVWFGAWIRRVTTEIAVTTQRVITKRGLFRRSTVEMNARQIESVQVDQSISGRVFNFGTITVRGTGAGIEPIAEIERPLALREAVRGLAASPG